VHEVAFTAPTSSPENADTAAAQAPGSPSDLGRAPALGPSAVVTSLSESWQRSHSRHADGPFQPGQNVGSRYTILKLLGAGGMGAVYQAFDHELGTAVAIKVIRAAAPADATAAKELEQRFKRELVLARQVTHKYVVRIHDIGEIDGIKYLTMPFVEGETLATILQRAGTLPLSRAIRIAQQVAHGLAAAHDRGVIHRDLKPENIMIERAADDPVQGAGDALIMDFGIARTVESGATQTRAGSVVGTLEYMAPEQAQGRKLDSRVDQYSLGLILYDMLVGRRRLANAESAMAELLGRIAEPPPAPSSITPDIPAPVNDCVVRCLQPKPEDRYPTTQDLVSVLDHLTPEGHIRSDVHEVIVTKTRPAWQLAAASAVIIALAGAAGWLGSNRRSGDPHTTAAAREPMSVIIAQFDNQTGDPVFDGTLEPILKFVMEGASFISAYDRRGIASSLGVRPPERLDERAALELAVKQGVGVVLSGSIGREGSGYGVMVKATEAVTGNVIGTRAGSAASKDRVLSVATELATQVREALGDDTSDTAQRFAMETLSATSLEVVREYAGAMEALSRSRFNDALKGFSNAVALDANFGLAYAGMAITSSNLGRQQDAVKYVQHGIRLVDTMTERERYRTRGMFFYLTNDYQACVKEYGDLIARYSADAAARNNRALCLSKLRDMSTAVNEMRHVVAILPSRGLYRVNLSTYAAYAGDFKTAEQEALNAGDQSPWSMQALALAQTGQGLIAQAAESYEKLGKVEDVGPSYTASGLADLAMYEGRFSDAARMLEAGAAADLKANGGDRAAIKFAALAYAHLQMNQNATAIASAERALANSQAITIRFLTARVFVEAGAEAKARPIAAALAAELQAEPQAYAKIIEGLVALKSGDTRQAIKILTDANALFDTWIGHFDLGRAYLEAGAFTQADSEFDRCLKRRGESLALFLDEEPTYGYFPPVYYFQGRVRQGLKSARFAESYRAYLDIRGKSPDDPLLPDIRRRAGL
jgi:tetratricopeptide (TPR) repeat protein